MTPPTDEDAIRQMRRMTRRGFAVGGVAAAAGLGSWWWLQSRSLVDGVAWPFRKVHEANEVVGRGLFSDRLAKEYDPTEAVEPRVNGWHGWSDGMPSPEKWTLNVHRPDAAEKRVALSALAGLPRVDTTFEFKCVEGWSQIVRWGGVRLGDFLRAFDLLPVAGSPLRYLLFTTPDEEYSSAIDLASALHPQAILCDSMNGQPLTQGHGAPIRLVLPVKYGIKNIKWISDITFQANKPTDYWTQRGYDWYAGL